MVAEFRAEENRQVTPLYRDPVVELFLDEDSREAAGLVAASFPPAKDLVRIRTKYLDDTLEKHLVSGFRQVVVLGAGLDTRAVRSQSTGVTYFEIDDAATLKLKQTRYQQRGIDANVTFIPGNYVTDGLMRLLKRSGFDVDLPTYLIWEGNTMYLPFASIRHTLAEIRTHVRRFRVSFDYMLARAEGRSQAKHWMASHADRCRSRVILITSCPGPNHLLAFRSSVRCSTLPELQLSNYDNYRIDMYDERRMIRPWWRSGRARRSC